MGCRSVIFYTMFYSPLFIRTTNTCFCACPRAGTCNRDEGLSELPHNRRFAFSVKHNAVFTSYIPGTKTKNQDRYALVHLPWQLLSKRPNAYLARLLLANTAAVGVARHFSSPPRAHPREGGKGGRVHRYNFRRHDRRLLPRQGKACAHNVLIQAEWLVRSPHAREGGDGSEDKVGLPSDLVHTRLVDTGTRTDGQQQQEQQEQQ